jgi:hypothetical protein
MEAGQEETEGYIDLAFFWKATGGRDSPPNFIQNSANTEEAVVLQDIR